MERFTAAKLRLLRRGERVPVDRRLDRSSDPSRQLQAGQRCTLIEEVLGREIREPEVLPPERTILPPVPIQQISQHPSRLLVRAPLLRRYRNIADDALHELGDPPLSVRQLFACFSHRS